jgi:hypothetical protein
VLLEVRRFDWGEIRHRLASESCSHPPPGLAVAGRSRAFWIMAQETDRPSGLLNPLSRASPCVATKSG